MPCETLAPGSTTYFNTDLTILVPARRVRVIKVGLEVVRSGRTTGTRERFKIDEDSLHQIRSEMPTENDDWVVEKASEIVLVISFNLNL